MSTRKPKPSFPSSIEVPSERLRLATVTVEPKSAKPSVRNWTAGELFFPELVPNPDKSRLH
jgi:hypothetical protein